MKGIVHREMEPPRETERQTIRGRSQGSRVAPPPQSWLEAGNLRQASFMRSVRRLHMVLLLVGNSLALSSPGRSRAAPPLAAVEARRMSFLSSNRLISDPALAALVDQLAKAPHIESARIGYAGSPSDAHALFTRISQAATAHQAVALLRHDSAVVRGYLAEHVVTTNPAELDAVYPLLADSTVVEQMSGCLIDSTTVSQVVLLALRTHLDRPAVQALLLRAAHDPKLGELRVEALQSVAKQRPTEATALAQSLLRESAPRLLAGAIRTLGITASSDSASSLCALASSAESEVRAAVAPRSAHYTMTASSRRCAS